MFNKLKQFKNLRNQAKELQEALRGETVEVEKGGIKIKMNGNQEVVEVSIEPHLLATERKGEVERAIQEAVNSAIEKTKRVMAQKMQSLGGLDQFGLGK